MQSFSFTGRALRLVAAAVVEPLPRQVHATEPVSKDSSINIWTRLVARNAFGLPLAQKVKFSENDQLLDLGDGLWNVTTDIGTYKLYVSDPQSGQVGFFGTVRENGRPTALAIRLKIDNRKISEIETLVFRGGGGPPPGGRGGRGPGRGDAKGPPPPPPPPTGAAALEEMKVDPVFLETPPADQRVSRDQLVKLSNTFFDAIEQGNAPSSAFDAQCARVENGVKVAAGCADQINSKVLSYIQTVYPRRPVVVDEERQLVFGFFMFQQPGDMLSVESPGKGIYKYSDPQLSRGSRKSRNCSRSRTAKFARLNR